MPAEALLATDLLDRRRQVVAEQACTASGLEVIEWTSSGAEAVGTSPTLILGGVATGARAIPESILKASAKHADARLVLLCDEPLVRPLVMLHDGRVWLVGPPHAEDTVRAGVMAALAARPPSATAAARPDRLQIEEASSGGCWIASLAAAPQAGQPLLSRHLAAGDGLCIALLAETEPDELEAASARLRREAASGIEKILDEVAAARIAALCCGERRWILHWPKPAWSAWVCSRSRLPQRWNVFPPGKRSLGSRQRVIPARAGDVVLACTRLPGKPDAAFAAALNGGHALLAWIRAAVEEEDAQAPRFAGFVAEMRR